MAKGSKRDRWYKDGIKISRKCFKKIWNRKVRKNKDDMSNGEYKKIAAESMFKGIL